MGFILCCKVCLDSCDKNNEKSYIKRFLEVERLYLYVLKGLNVWKY